MGRKQRRGAVAFCLLALLVAFVGWQTWRVVRQAQCDHALIAAIEANDTQATITWLNKGANPNAVGTETSSASVWQIFLNRLRGLHAPENTGRTALILALNTREGDEENPHANLALVRALLSKRANVNQPDSEAWTPLMRAAQLEDADVIKVLLDYHADVNLRNPDGDDATAIAEGWIKRWMTPQRVGAVRRLLDTTEAFEADKNGWTPLMYAAQNKRAATVQTLLENGVEVNARNHDDETALMLAAQVSGNSAVLKRLLASGADVDAHTRAGETALMRVAYNGDTDGVQLLLDSGADINAEAEVRGMGTPLMYAVIAGHLPVVKLLLLRGANPNTTITPIVADPKPTSPLSYAGDSHRNDIVALLRHAGAKK